MNESGLIACSILKSMNIVMLKRLAPKKYTLLGEIPPFYLEYFCDESGKPSCEPWLISPMLDLFLEDAEEFFQIQQQGESLVSSTWQEDGKTTENTAFICIAAEHNGSQVLLLRLLDKDYQEYVGMLRKARKQLLEKRDMAINLEKYKEKLRIDGLTKIFNKVTFIDLLQDEIKRSVLLNYPLALLLIDIDDFKNINDLYGHLIGDRVLEVLGRLLADFFETKGIVARFGGEEFTVLIAQVNEEQAFSLANDLKNKIADTKFPEVPGVTVSIGCSIYIQRETMEHFINRADVALYSAKNSGKNRVCSSQNVF